MGRLSFALLVLACAGASLAVYAGPADIKANDVTSTPINPQGGEEAGGVNYKPANNTKLKRVIVDDTKPLSTAMKCTIILLTMYFLVQV